MFIKEDIYTTSSSLKLYHCWTDKVTKFDSSAFYNWEQDNMPVYDLEERTFYLWEKLGYPTSSIPGVVLAVSADATDADVRCNKNVFRSVSAAVDALPETINFPIIIEVANFGQMGDLVLNNFRFGPRGSLEIINRNFARSHAYGFFNLTGLGSFNLRLNNGLVDSTTPNNYSYFSAIARNVDGAASLPSFFDASSSFKDSSCLSISCAVFSSTTDNRLNGNCNGFISIPTTTLNAINTFKNSLLNKGSLVVASKNSLFGGDPNVGIKFKTYDLNADSAEDISTRDVSTIDFARDGISHIYSKDVDNSYAANGLLYGNLLNKVVINNCEGPIYIRNFFVDGSGVNNTTNFNGIEVTNSNNIYLENIIATRFRKAGFVFNNSNVTLLRGCVATRNYNFDSGSKRISGLWSSKKYFNTFNSTYDYITADDAAGLLANNSTITVSSTRNFEDLIYKSNVISKFTGATYPPVDFSSFTNANYIFDFSKNSNGLILNNSTLKGGDTQNIDLTDHFKYTINLNVYGNTECGIKSQNSKILFDGRFNIYENLFGVKLDSSIFEIDKLSLVANQKTGLESINSNILYNKNLAPYVNAGSNSETFSPLMFSANGQHIVLSNSKMLPVLTSGMDAIYDQIIFKPSIGVRDGVSSIVPGVEVLNNSEIVLISPYLYRDSTHSTQSTKYTPIKGSELCVLNHSKATLKGTRYFPTKVFGPNGRDYQKTTAGVYAGENSTIEFNGPTVIANYGVDIFAENNSVVNINPPRQNSDGALDLSSFNLLNKLNHTVVELHATRSCIVVDNNSTFNARDLGSFKRTWDTTGNYYSNRSLSGITYNTIDDIHPYVSGGGLQFYPNPIPSGAVDLYGGSFPGVDNLNVTALVRFQSNTNPGSYYIANQDTLGSLNFTSVTNGGFCLRAFNNSIVNVHNVNFPTAWWNCSAPYYDNTNGNVCFKTFIWNIGDNSKLNASYLSVSSLYPKAAGYIGPSAVWTSGASNNLVASGLPSSTPDTSSVSILDLFGVSPASANPFAKSSPENYGPFRLYFSVDPAVNVLKYNNSDVENIINQIYAQGYQPSASMQVNSQVSSLYLSLVNRNSSNNLVASGFYYGSSFHKTGNYENIILDESASETFANAKHCAVGKSGNVKLVSIYYPYATTTYGDLYNTKGVISFNSFDLQRDN